MENGNAADDGSASDGPNASLIASIMHYRRAGSPTGSLPESPSPTQPAQFREIPSSLVPTPAKTYLSDRAFASPHSGLCFGDKSRKQDEPRYLHVPVSRHYPHNMVEATIEHHAARKQTQKQQEQELQQRQRLEQQLRPYRPSTGSAAQNGLQPVSSTEQSGWADPQTTGTGIANTEAQEEAPSTELPIPTSPDVPWDAVNINELTAPSGYSGSGSGVAGFPVDEVALAEEQVRQVEAALRRPRVQTSRLQDIYHRIFGGDRSRTSSELYPSIYRSKRETGVSGDEGDNNMGPTAARHVVSSQSVQHRRQHGGRHPPHSHKPKSAGVGTRPRRRHHNSGTVGRGRGTKSAGGSRRKRTSPATSAHVPQNQGADDGGPRYQPVTDLYALPGMPEPPCVDGYLPRGRPAANGSSAPETTTAVEPQEPKAPLPARPHTQGSAGHAHRRIVAHENGSTGNGDADDDADADAAASANGFDNGDGYYDDDNSRGDGNHIEGRSNDEGRPAMSPEQRERQTAELDTALENADPDRPNPFTVHRPARHWQPHESGEDVTVVPPTERTLAQLNNQLAQQQQQSPPALVIEEGNGSNIIHNTEPFAGVEENGDNGMQEDGGAVRDDTTQGTGQGARRLPGRRRVIIQSSATYIVPENLRRYSPATVHGRPRCTVTDRWVGTHYTLDTTRRMLSTAERQRRSRLQSRQRRRFAPWKRESQSEKDDTHVAGLARTPRRPTQVFGISAPGSASSPITSVTSHTVVPPSSPQRFPSSPGIGSPLPQGMSPQTPPTRSSSIGTTASHVRDPGSPNKRRTLAKRPASSRRRAVTQAASAATAVAASAQPTTSTPPRGNKSGGKNQQQHHHHHNHTHHHQHHGKTKKSPRGGARPNPDPDPNAARPNDPVVRRSIIATLTTQRSESTLDSEDMHWWAPSLDGDEDWADSPLGTLTSYAKQDEEMEEAMAELYMNVGSQDTMSEFSGAFELAASTLLNLHMDLGCPYKVHSEFVLDHEEHTSMNFAAYLSRLTRLQPARTVLKETLLRARMLFKQLNAHAKPSHGGGAGALGDISTTGRRNTDDKTATAAALAQLLKGDGEGAPDGQHNAGELVAGTSSSGNGLNSASPLRNANLGRGFHMGGSADNYGGDNAPAVTEEDRELRDAQGAEIRENASRLLELIMQFWASVPWPTPDRFIFRGQELTELAMICSKQPE